MKSLMLFLTACVAASSFGQASFDYRAANIKVLELAPVQAAIGLTSTQHEQLKAYANAYDVKLNLERSKVVAQIKAQGRNYKGDGGQAAVMQLIVTLKKQVLGVLSARQLQRLRELSLQVEGLGAIVEDDAVRDRLGVTSAQAKQLAQAYQAGSDASDQIEKQLEQPILLQFKSRAQAAKTDADRKELEQEFEKRVDDARRAAAPSFERVQEKTKSQFLAILTASQQKAWKAMLGVPFRGR